MCFSRLKLEYSVKGNLNYIAWKDKMEAMFEDNKLKGIDGDIPHPTATDAQILDAWKKNVAKA